MPSTRATTFAGLIRALSAAAVALLLCGGWGGWGGTALGQDSASVDVKVLHWGVGGAARPGGWIGVQVQVTDLGQTTREVLLELAMPDPDGDTTLYQTTLAVGGEKKAAWLYARLPFSAFIAQEFVVTAHAVVEPSSAQRVAGVVRGGELLGRTRFRLNAQPIEARVGLFGVVGRNLAGLKNFTTDAGYGSNHPPMAHEKVELVGMSVSTIPDRWMGLNEMETIVWTGTGPDMEPSELSEDSAAAIREWVMRGGHLVVVLPAVGQTWTDPRQPLAEIFPRVSVQRLENVDLNPYRPLLTDKEVALPTSGVVQVLEPLPDAKPGEATRILTGPDGKGVVVSRVVGCGAVTVVGLDVGSRTLEGLNAVKADVFWNRVLGRRGQLISDAEVTKSREVKNYAGPKNFTSREPRALDQDIASLINKTGKAFLGVMLAFVLFAMYWVVAGPLGFWTAKRNDKAKHAWVGFVAVGAVFTLVAWTGASWLKPGETDAQHLTIVDHVYGQPLERAKVWASVLLPRFGLMDVGIGDPAAPTDAKNPIHDTLAPWDPAPNELAGAASSKFADSQGYGVNSRSPSKVLTPARSTTKNYVGEWLGGPAWKMPMPFAEDGVTPGAISLVSDSGGTDRRMWKLDGMLKHELPGTLKDVTVVVVRGQRPVKGTESYIGQLQTEGEYFEVQNWKPGETLDLDNEQRVWGALYQPGGRSSLLNDLVGHAVNYNDPNLGLRGGRGGGVPQREVTPGSVKNRLIALSFFGVLEPPDARVTDQQVLVQRADAHRYDLSRWFSRPCVIVIGQMENAPSPVPLTLNGEPMGTTGRTVVRWIYPLPESPPRITGN